MRFRKLRIAWSVSLVLIVLLLPGTQPGWDGGHRPPWLIEHELEWAIPTLLLAAAAWLPLRFTLRTLLIATTLVAVVLGVIVWPGH